MLLCRNPSTCEKRDKKYAGIRSYSRVAAGTSGKPVTSLERDNVSRVSTHAIAEQKNEDPEEEQMLLRRLAEGDRNAFWKIWEGHQKFLYGVCFRQMGGNREDAEDALSQAMMKAWEKLPAYAGEIANIKAWLTRLIQNLCLDVHRERERRARGVQNLEEITAANEAIARRSFESPEKAFLRREMYAHISHAIEELPPRLREPVILRFLQDMPYRNIAEHLTLSPDNVRKCIQQARPILQGRLTGYLSRKSLPQSRNPVC